LAFATEEKAQRLANADARLQKISRRPIRVAITYLLFQSLVALKRNWHETERSETTN
jgi:hypothetical protein